MKVAITSYGKDLTSDVDQRFGRAGWFIVVDTETGGYEAVNNEKNLTGGGKHQPFGGRGFDHGELRPQCLPDTKRRRDQSILQR